MKKISVKWCSVLFLVCAVIFQLITITRAKGWYDFYQISSLAVVILGTVGSIASIFIPSSYVCHISPNDWISQKGEWILSIPVSEHGMGRHPKVATYIVNTDGSRNEVGVGVVCRNNGDILVSTAIECDSVIEVIVT